MNGGMEFHETKNVDVKSLLYRILNDKKSYTKDERITACEQLQQTLIHANDVANIGYDWKKLVEDLLHCIKTRQQIELKRCVSDCLGSLGSIMFSQYNEYLKLMLNEAKLIPDKYEDDRALLFKAIFSSLNLIGAFEWQSRIRPQDVDLLMTEIKNWLEVNDSSVVLISLLDTCLAVSKYFPAIFKHSFDDVVDFTVGWYIEPEQPLAVLDKCCQMLVELRPYWHSSVPSAVTLMKQFLDDASAYIEDVETNESKPENMLSKTAAILRALTTMLEIMNIPVNPVVADFAEKIFERIVGLLTHLDNIFAAKIGNVFVYMAEVLCMTLKTYPKSDFLVDSMKSLKIMLEHPSVNEKTMLTIIGCSGKIIDSVTPKMVLEVVDYIVGDDGPLNCVITRSQEVMQAYSNVLGKLLVPKNLSTLQVAYNRVCRDVRICLKMLRETEVQAYCSDSFMIEKKLMIYFNALYSLAVVKNSLIAMMGLSPALFAFLMTETPITEREFIVNHPGCHYALLYIVKMHSEKHENFVANSSLLIDKNSLTLVTEPATAKYTTTILKVVTKLLAIDDLIWTDTRNLLVEWIHGLVFSLTSDVLQHILDKPEIIKMRAALLDSFVRNSLPRKTPLDNKTLCNPEIVHGSIATTSHRIRHFALLRRLAVFNLVKNGRPEMTAEFVRRVFEQCHSGSQDKIAGIWQATPPILFISNGLTECAQDLMEFGQQKISESLFTSEHFRIVSDFLLNSVLPIYFFNSIDDGNWVSDTAATIYADAMGDINTNNDCMSKWRWIIAQMAQFCVNNRLKTPLGKPLDTFLAFENEIRRLAGSALSRKPIPVGKIVKDEIVQKVVEMSKRGVVEDEDEAEVEAERETRQLTSSEQWWRVRALLDMIEMLDKLIVYACRGAVFQLSTVSQLSQQFLITNQASCANWLSRLCLPMMAVAYTSNNFAQVVRLGSCSLRDIGKRIEEKGTKDSTDEKAEIDSVAHTCITWMVKALIDLGRPQAILGLYAWVKKIYGKQYAWIRCAAQMAAGRIESALDGLRECLRNENLSENIQKTIRELIMFGLEVLRNSEEIDVFWRTLCGVLDPKSDEIPDGFEEIAWKRMKSLTMFDNCLKNESLLSVPWDIRNSFIHTELKLMDIVHDQSRDSKDNKTDVVDLTRQLSEDSRILMLADTNLQTFTRASALHLLATAVKDSRKAYHKQSVTTNVIDPSFLFDKKNSPPMQRLFIGQQLSSWLQHTQIRENGGCSSLRVISNESSYHLEMARLARKTENYRLAEKHMKIHYNKRLPTLDNFQLNILRGMRGNWINVATDKENKLTNNVAVQLPMQQRLYNFENLMSSYGFSKMMWAISETADTDRARSFLQGKAFSLLMNAVADEVDRLMYKSNLMFNGTPTVAPDALIAVVTQQLNHTIIEDSTGPNICVGNQQQLEQNKLSAKAIIQLARWLQMESSLLPVAMSHSMRIAFHMFGVEQSQLPLLGASGIIDSLTGALLSTACKLSPHLAKAHLELGNWAFKRVTDADNDIRLLFISEECDTVKWQIKNACASVEDSVVENLLQTVQKSTTLSSILPDCKSLIGGAICEQTCDILFGPRSVIQEIWKGANSRHLAFCVCAVHSYFAYIAVSGLETKEGTIGIVMATLRILQLLVKHYDALHHLILNEMLQVNELMWKDILPQLFARLNHPVRAVRDTLCTILERIATTAPHALCYPVIVGATQPIVIHNEYADNAEVEKNDFVDVIDEEKKKRADQDRSLMFECCQRIVTRMQELFPGLVRDVTEFVKELQRIDMLHEERWAFVLTNLDLEMNRRISQIEAEKMKTLMNTHLSDDAKKEIIHEKTIIFTSLVYRIVEDLYGKTCTNVPRTVNEKQFQDTYLATIEKAMQSLRLKRSEPLQAWASFKLLLAELNQRANRRSFVCLQMADISPRLTALNKTHVPLPGQEHKNFSDVVMLERISKQTVILPTKTRPRKVIFHGSDGKDYPFLFKGQEDLHLDERIMQLLRICNLMLSTKEADWPSYVAENYSVVPLGSRSGLIEWVEGATPIFQVYRKWQLRQAAENISNQKMREVERPSALFFKKLRATFQANKIPKESITDRQKWPFPILKSVVEDLIGETPRDLLSRELWLRSGSSDTWFRVTERFARSTAVMSVVGSILGVGDRHLDNVLVNFEFGHVVHIDYNVCFDKGRNLRVPETVPFRLTGNIVRALGPTDVEGTFRLSSENVLGKLRAGKEILLTMLDAFVYDPLVDWAAAQDDLGSKSMIGIATIIAVYGGVDNHSDILYAMAVALFALRIKELSTSWLHNRNHLKCTLTSVISTLGKLCENSQSTVENRLQNWEEEANKLRMEKLSVERDLKNAVAEHHSIMHDMRPLLRSFAQKNESFAVYLQRYKELFSEPLIKGLKLLDDECSSSSVCINIFQSVIDIIPSIYDNLLLLEKVKERVELPFSSDKSSEMERNERQQQQNLHGKHVSKKVRMKLEGMITPSGNKNDSAKNDASIVSEPLTPAEQIDLLIQQATDISNLALMYEGWTAWV